jgi:hypothetical protein
VRWPIDPKRQFPRADMVPPLRYDPLAFRRLSTADLVKLESSFLLLSSSFRRKPESSSLLLFLSAELSLALRASESPFFACAKKGNRNKHPPSSAPSGHPALQVRERVPGVAERTSLCAQRPRAHPARDPSGFSSTRSPRHRGPISAASCRRSKARYSYRPLRSARHSAQQRAESPMAVAL